MKKQTYLFFPIEVGLAHITRALAVAEELHAHGHRVIFALPKRKQPIFAKSSVPMVDIPSYVEKDEEMVVKTFSDYSFLKRHVVADLELIRGFRPDVVVVDFRFSALAAARIAKAKAVFITNGSIVPCGSYIPNQGFPPFLYGILGPMAEWTLKTGMRIFLRNLVRIVEEYGEKVNLEKWFESVPYIIPEPKDYFPPHRNSLQLICTGPLAWKGFETDPPPWLQEIRPDGKTIYITFGGTGFNKKRLIELADSLEKEGYRIIVTTGSLCSPEDFPKRKNIFAVKYLPGNEVCRRVDAVLCHGGFGTLMEAMVAGKPIIAVPFNPDQINHSARMQDLGLGRSMFRLAIHDVFHIFSFRWDRIESKSRNIPLERIIRTTEEVLEKREEYAKNYRKFREKYPIPIHSAQKAAEFIVAFGQKKK